MKLFPEFNSLGRDRIYGQEAAFRYIDTVLQDLEVVDCAGIQVLSLGQQNLTSDDQGHFTITIQTLESPLVLGTIMLRDHAGVLELSGDAGTTWTPIGVTTLGDMVKSIYDTNDDGCVDQAAALKDGSGTLDANGIRALIPSGVGDMTKAVYDTNDDGCVDQAAALKDGSGTLDANGIRALIGSINQTLTIDPVYPIPYLSFPLRFGNATFYIVSDFLGDTPPPIVDQTGNVAITLQNGTPTHTQLAAKYSTSSIYFPQGSFLAIDDAKVNVGMANFIFMAWVKLPNSGHQKIFTIPNILQLATQYPGGGCLYLDSGYGDATGTTNICDDNWHHVALRRVGNSMTVSVDGVQEFAINIGSDRNYTENRVTIGNEISAGQYGVNNGYLDDIYFKVGSAFFASSAFTPPGFIRDDPVFNGQLIFAGQYA